jgi:hypothetical protein
VVYYLFLQTIKESEDKSKNRRRDDVEDEDEDDVDEFLDVKNGKSSKKMRK